MSDCLPPKYDLVLQYSLYYTLHIFILMFSTPWKYRDVTKDNFFDRVKKFIYFKYKMSSFFTSNIKNFSISLWWSWEFYFIYETIIQWAKIQKQVRNFFSYFWGKVSFNNGWILFNNTTQFLNHCNNFPFLALCNCKCYEIGE